MTEPSDTSDERPKEGTAPGGMCWRTKAILGASVAVVVAVLAAVVISVTSNTPSAGSSATTIAPVPTTLPALTEAPPPPTSTPQAPGTLLASGIHESDPFLLEADGHYWLYSSGSLFPTVNVPVSATADFSTFSPVRDALPTLPAWAASGFTWAPDVHRFQGHYVLYFTDLLQNVSPPTECIGIATGPTPAGPFHASAQPFICQKSLGGSIDPRVFVDHDGQAWMLWKSDQNIGGATTPTQMWSQQLSANGETLNGPLHLLLSPDEPWQGTIVEAPDLRQVNGAYWLLYSGNWFNQTGYGVGIATCAGPAGPCHDTSAQPLIGSNEQGSGPGEASWFTNGSATWLLYTPTLATTTAGPRPVAITRVGFHAGSAYLAAGGPPPPL